MVGKAHLDQMSAWVISGHEADEGYAIMQRARRQRQSSTPQPRPGTVETTPRISRVPIGQAPARRQETVSRAK